MVLQVEVVVVEGERVELEEVLFLVKVIPEVVLRLLRLELEEEVLE
jgi:hypothetical protein